MARPKAEKAPAELTELEFVARVILNKILQVHGRYVRFKFYLKD
jgi:hypothetical protein